MKLPSNQIMKLKWWFAAAGLMLAAWLAYLGTQQPKVWCNSQWAGVALLRGGYRSWTLTFSDGMAYIDGKMRPVTIKDGKCRVGYHWPTYSHLDVRKLVL